MAKTAKFPKIFRYDVNIEVHKITDEKFQNSSDLLVKLSTCQKISKLTTISAYIEQVILIY